MTHSPSHWMNSHAELARCLTTKLSQNMVTFSSMSRGRHKSTQEFLHSWITYATRWFDVIHLCTKYIYHIRNEMIAWYGSFQNNTWQEQQPPCMDHMGKIDQHFVRTHVPHMLPIRYVALLWTLRKQSRPLDWIGIRLIQLATAKHHFDEN